MTRKKPFSGKAKKEQLVAKRVAKTGQASPSSSKKSRSNEDDNRTQDEDEDDDKPSGRGAGKTMGDLRTDFASEPKWLVDERKKDATLPLVYHSAEEKDHHVYANGLGKRENNLGMPKRPVWTYEMTPEELDHNEQTMFRTWLEEIHEQHPLKSLNYFEHNLQVWRQLWRTIEKSDVLLYLIDSRFPALHFSPSLYEYIVNEHGKDVILCLNKTDLIPRDTLEKWVQYFKSLYPDMLILTYQARHADQGNTQVMGTNAQMMQQMEAFKEILSQSHVVKNEERHSARKYVYPEKVVEEDKTDPEKYMTIGIIGDPNMGKSTFINSLFQKKVVSQSATPGHTKHFQTLFLTPTIRFCDCPGVVFPKLGVGREIQVLFGSYPIAQTREPYSAIRYLSEYCEPKLQTIYKLQPPLDKEELADLRGEYEWSPYSIAEAYAKKRNYNIKGGGLDTYRAANELLRNSLNGSKPVLYFGPPPFSEQ